MKKPLFLIIFSLLTFISCDQGNDTVPEIDPPSNAINKIMPLGASRVEGARPVFESYRFELWKLLTDGGWDFDYIGTMNDPANYPSYLNQSFDNDHEGRGGWTSGQILDGINTWLSQAGSPDIVLFSSPGGNDALQALDYNQTVSNINQIIDEIQAVNPNVTIVIEQLAPARSDLMTPSLTTYFNQIQEDVLNIASAQTTNSSKVLTVDMNTEFDDTLLADDVHYNEAGANFIATRYYEVLVNILN